MVSCVDNPSSGLKVCTKLVKCNCKVLKAGEEDVHVRKQSGNVLSYVAVIVKKIIVILINFVFN